MKEMKFKVKSSKHSKAIQQRLFELGYEWSIGGKQYAHTTEPYLFTWGDKRLTYANTDKTYKIQESKEATLDDLYDSEETIMTIRELEEKHGYTNLKIVKEK